MNVYNVDAKLHKILVSTSGTTRRRETGKKRGVPPEEV